jgi:hypothetical protein
MKSDPEGCGGKEYIIGIQNTDREMYRCLRILALRTELRLTGSNFHFLETNKTQTMKSAGKGNASTHIRESSIRVDSPALTVSKCEPSESDIPR